MTPEQRELCGQKGREWAIGEGGLNATNMCDQFMKAMDYTFEKWTPADPVEIVTINDYVGNLMPQGDLGLEMPTINIDKVKKEIESAISSI
jgi:hypothetical protein